jgi:predicted  nucleic acid-binding Zn-ribbon protein
MKEQLRILCQLQQLEQQKAAILAQKAKVNSDEVRLLWQDIRLLTQNTAADREKLQQMEETCGRQETDLAAVTRQCQQMERKLYGGEITNLKELDQVKTKCETVRKDIAKREEEVFANMEHCEQLKGRIGLAESQLAEKKRQHAEKQHKLAHVLGDFDNQIAAVETQYISLASRVEAAIMHKFRDLARRMPMPVAKLEHGICGGCRMNVPTRQEALGKLALVYCDNCGRILLVD